jgi:hypothetical protein
VLLTVPPVLQAAHVAVGAALWAVLVVTVVPKHDGHPNAGRPS